MEVTVEIPDEVANQLQLNGDKLPRRLLGSFAAEGYKSGELTHGQVGRILSLSWHQVEAFLKEHNAELHYTEEDLEQDKETNRYLRQLREKELSQAE